MQKTSRRLGLLFLAACSSLGLWAQSNADPSGVARGDSGSTMQDIAKALELMRKDPTEYKNWRLGSKPKDIRFKMLVRKSDDRELSPEYAWSTKPKALKTAPQVVYPSDLLLAGEAGKATVRFRIDYAGRVDMSTVLEATKPEFGRAAQAALETMTFSPAKKKDGTPALVLCDADFDFSPDGSGDVPVPVQVRDLIKAAQKQPDAVVPSRELDKRLHPLSTTNPVYPTALAKKGTVGKAVIEFTVTEEGWVALPRALSATEPEFGAAAVHAVSLWQFDPPEKKGRTVSTRARIEIEFNPAAKPAS